MKIYIVMLHYKRLEVTQKCIESLSQHEDGFEKIILVNNDEQTILPEQFAISKKKLHIIHNKKNLGFAGGVNVGIRYALTEKADYILLLNNDTTIEKGFIKKIVSTFAIDTKAGIVGPAITFQTKGKTLFDLGGRVDLLTGRTQHDEVETLSDTKPRIVTYVSGCCMLIKRDVFETSGYFDEQFFLYYEDVDFCLRAAKNGWKSFVDPSAVIYHELSTTIGKLTAISVYHQTKSGVLFGKKYCTIPLVNLLFLCAQSCLFLFKKREAGLAAFKGLWDGIVL